MLRHVLLVLLLIRDVWFRVLDWTGRIWRFGKAQYVLLYDLVLYCGEYGAETWYSGMRYRTTWTPEPLWWL